MVRENKLKTSVRGALDKCTIYFFVSNSIEDYGINQ